jgi:hypothetical protein
MNRVPATDLQHVVGVPLPAITDEVPCATTARGVRR